METNQQEQMRAAFKDILEHYETTDADHVGKGYRVACLDALIQAATSTHAEQIKQLQDRIAELENTKLKWDDFQQACIRKIDEIETGGVKLPPEDEAIKIMLDAYFKEMHVHMIETEGLRRAYRAIKQMMGGE